MSECGVPAGYGYVQCTRCGRGSHYGERDKFKTTNLGRGPFLDFFCQDCYGPTIKFDAQLARMVGENVTVTNGELVVNGVLESYLDLYKLDGIGKYARFYAYSVRGINEAQRWITLLGRLDLARLQREEVGV